MELNQERERFLKYKKKLIEIINKNLPGCKIYLFGSRARGDYSLGADIDLALDVGNPIDINIISELKDEISETNIPLFVDLVDLWSASEKFKKEVESQGILWEN